MPRKHSQDVTEEVVDRLRGIAQLAAETGLDGSPALLTPAEVREVFRGEVSLSTLSSWRSRRQGPPYVKVGSSPLYPADKLAQWLESRLVGAGTGP